MLSQDSFSWEQAPLQFPVGCCFWSPKPKSHGCGRRVSRSTDRRWRVCQTWMGAGVEEGLQGGTQSPQQ